MIIGKYKVAWVSAGFSYAVAVVYIKKRYRFLPFSRWVQVWQGGNAVTCGYAQRMLKKTTVDKFNSAIAQYEEYQESWSEQ